MTRMRVSQLDTRDSSPCTSTTSVLTPSTEGTRSYGLSDTVPVAERTPRSLATDMAMPTPSFTATEGSQDAALADGLSRICLLSVDGDFHLSELNPAIDNLSSSSNNPERSCGHEARRTSEHLSPPPAPAARRRSSSKIKQPPHVVEDEEPPQDRFHAATFQQAFLDTKDLVTDLKGVLGSSELHLQSESTVHRLYEKAASLNVYISPSKRIVGFVGDSGVGKSSLLNALLDARSLARTSNAGAACTCIATEYHYHDLETFGIEVDLFSIDELDEMLHDMLEVFLHYMKHGDDMTGEEKVDYEERSRVAEHTILSMFRDHLQGSSRMLTDDSKDSVLAKLRAWVRDNTATAFEGRRLLNSLADCSSYLVQLTSDPSKATERAIWPFIKRLRVFLKAHALSKGLVLVDLPGLKDLNTARRDITERYILDCDEVFAIAYIGRAASDEGVKRVIDLVKRANLSNVGIVCTKSDDIKASEALTDWKGQKANHIRRLMDKVDAIEDELKQVKDELIDDEEEADLSEEELEVTRQLMRKLSRLSKDKDDSRFELKQYLITTRNRIISESLQNIYEHIIPNRQLKVFCVSNDDYWLQRNSPRNEAIPLLQLSGIIALRKHCISIVSESQYQSAVKYIRHDVAALLNDIELWIRSVAPSLDAERKHEIREAVDTIERRLRRALFGRSSQLRGSAPSLIQNFEGLVEGGDAIHRAFENTLPTAICLEWSQAARGSAIEWSRWAHNTYSAFCRNYGDYCTDTVGSHNWNEEASEAMTRDMSRPWQTLMKRIQDKQEEFVGSLTQILDSSVEYLDANIAASSELNDTLADAIMSRRELIIDEFERAAETLSFNLMILKTDVFSGIRTSFMGQAMEPAYRACNMESGTGSHGRRKEIMRRHISHEALFEGILKKTTKQIKFVAKEYEAEVKRILGEQFEEIRVTLSIARNDNAATEGEQDPEFRQRVDTVLQTSQVVLRNVVSALDGQTS